MGHHAAERSDIPTTRCFRKRSSVGPFRGLKIFFPGTSKSSTRSTGDFSIRFAAAIPRTPAAIARMSLIEEGPVKKVRMANLAIVGSHSINGVAAIHTELLKSHVVPDFAQMFPGAVQQ